MQIGTKKLTETHFIKVQADMIDGVYQVDESENPACLEQKVQ